MDYSLLLQPNQQTPTPQKNPLIDTTNNITAMEPPDIQEQPNDAPTALEPRPLTPENEKPRSNLDLISECDSFPSYTSNPADYLKHIITYYHFQIASLPGVTLGYVLPSVAEVLRGLPSWTLNDEERTLTLTAGTNEQERSAAIAATTAGMRETGHFAVLKGWRNELYPVYGPGPLGHKSGGEPEVLFSIERAASCLFGVVTYGIHMTAFVRQKNDDGEEELKIWVPRRARTKQTYGGMLDNTVAGGIATGEKPFESLVREAAEEASLPESLVRKHAKAAGVVSYFYIRDERAGGETKLLQPEVQYIYDLELPEDVTPKPSDDEVEEFYLWSVDEINGAMRKGEFKPNCALVMLDFFVRHGVLTQENEKDFIEIASRLHRRLEFPTP